MKTLSNRLRLYCCPTCGAIMAGYGAMKAECCGVQVEELTVENAAAEAMPQIQEIDGGYYLLFDNPMTKDFYIASIVVEYYDHYETYRLFPEQDPSIHIHQTRGAKLHVVYRQQDNVWQCVFNV